MTENYEQARDLMRKLVEVAKADGDNVAHGFITFVGSFFDDRCTDGWSAKFTHSTIETSDAETILEIGDDPLVLVRQIAGATPWAGRVL